MKKLLLFSFILAFTFPSEINAQRKKSKDKETTQSSTKTKQSKKPKYADFVKKDTKTDDGVFKVHENDNKYMYEIPKTFYGASARGICPRTYWFTPTVSII